jgi:hypothetical protein
LLFKFWYIFSPVFFRIPAPALTLLAYAINTQKSITCTISPTHTTSVVLLNELRWANNKKKKKRKKVYLNNSNSGGVSFTEVHFKGLHGYCSATYLNARNQLIEVGFIKQNYRGGMCRGDCARYRLLCVDGVRQESQRWRRYPEENWAEDIPKLKKQMVGVKTQFKKGKSGRKTKATL